MTRASLLLALAVCAAPASAADATSSAARGQRLFNGDIELAARIVGQDFALPAQASRCVNCHAPARASAASSLANAQPIAPPLTLSSLTEPLRRRGGPPSRYDAASLCTLLRSGVDPAYVMILRTMPRYEISDADCQSLWQHLSAATPR
jgi:mono/diheme cytochrome c family protein